MYRDTVTVFNRREVDGKVLWYPTVLDGVDLNADHAALVAKYGSSCNDRAVLHVKYGWHDGPIVGGKQYRTPLLWQSAESPETAITFAAGDAFDFFVEGSWPAGGSPIMDEDWPGGLYDHLVRTQDGVYAISSVAQYSIIPHFEITGR